MEKLLLFYLRHFPLELGKKRIASLLSFNNINGEFVYTTSEGLKFNINMKEYVMKQIYMFDIYEKPYVKLLSSFPKNNINNIIDIGANIGNYTISLKKAYPNSRIHSFEPNSTNYRRLTSNIELNNFNNINANKKGLSDKKCTLNLYFDEKNMGAASLANEAGLNSEQIELDTLDNYCDTNGINNLDLMKIDIEGGELNCLKGGRNILSKTVKGIIQLEIDYGHCERLGYTSTELFEFLKRYGYKPFLMNRFGKINPAKNLPNKFIGNVIYLKGY